MQTVYGVRGISGDPRFQRRYGRTSGQRSFITTGTFTPAAVKEVTRDGAPPIDLLDGVEFAAKLKELSIGIRTERIELVHIDEDWFDTL